MRSLLLLPLLLSCVETEPAVQTPDTGTAPDPNDASTTPDAGHVDAQTDDSGLPDATALPQDAGTADLGSPELPSVDAGLTHECPEIYAVCTSFTAREACVDTPAGRRSITDTCPPGAGCIDGVCFTGQCTDQCTLGQISTGKTCVLFDLNQGAEVTPDPVSSMADRARLYQKHLVERASPAGGVVNVVYHDPAHTTPAFAGGSGDSAIWTGTYLMAEAARARAQPGPGVDASLERLVDTLDLWLHVSGHRAFLARYAESLDNPVTLSPAYHCTTDREHHCDVVYQGERFNYKGGTSRDQYQGVMSGLGLAYGAARAEATKEKIRANLVAVVEELMVERVIDVEFNINGASYDRPMTSRYLILNPDEMTDGKAVISIDTNAPEGFEDNATLNGVREFVPNMADIFRQVRLLSWLPDIPRPGSCIMLSAFFLTALEATENVPAYAQRRQAIEAFYNAHAAEWLQIATGWNYNRQCGAKYYGTNITYTPMYNWARLVRDPTRQQVVRNDLLLNTMWATVSGHKNAWFAFLTAGTITSPAQSIIDVGVTQTSLFVPPPHANWPMSQPVPLDQGCNDEQGNPQARDPLNVNLRAADDFQWQRNPWRRFSAGTGQIVYPGVDYVAAYWMGRSHGFLTDDRPGVCTVMR